MKIQLTDRAIAGLAPPAGKTEDFAWDADLAGFGVRVRRRPDGCVLRTYVVQYRANGRTRRSTVGGGARITLAQARGAARKLLAQVELGADPQADKATKRQRGARTFKATVDAYLEARRGELRPASLRVTTLYLTGPYFRPLHAIGIADIEHADIAARLTAITRTHSAHTASCARRAVSALFGWATEEGWVTTNPVAGTRKPVRAPARDRVLTDAELAAAWKACGDDDFGKIVRLLILTGARRSEVGDMTWSEIDLDAGTWTLPAARSKNHRAHTVPLPATAVEILRSVPRAGRDHLFGDGDGAGFARWSRAKAELDRRLGAAAWRVHDLRRTVATGMIGIGIEPHHVEAVLNHFSGHRRGVAGVYNRSPYERQMKMALARWAEHVAALAEGRESNVVALAQQSA
jgi:integrase